MYQWNGKQRKRTNVTVVFFFLSKSSSKSRPKRSHNVRPENLKYAICGQYAKSGERKKFRISQMPRAENLQKTSSYFKDEIYTRIADLKGFSIEEFGDSISFCDPERKSQSLFAFSSSIEVQNVINVLRNIDVVKTAAI